MNMSIEIMGWIGSVLIVGSYALNISGKLKANSKWYVWANIVGGFLFIINTYFHEAYPSMLVNIVWVIIALVMIFKNKKNSAV
jgi:hypothetical protein